MNQQDFEKELRNRGFDSLDDYNRAILNAQLTHKFSMVKFDAWVTRKGTKAELERISQEDAEL